MKQINNNGSAMRSLLAMVLAALMLAAQSVPASAAEKSLAGIAIFSKAKSVLAKYGNPSSIQVGRNFVLGTGGASGQPSGQGGAPSQSPGALPGFGVVTPPGAYAGAAGVGSPAGPSASASPAADPANGEVTWIYDRPGGVNYEFTMSGDGRVVQIRVTGYKGSVRTGRGIGLGMNYGQVLQKYGFPEQQVTAQSTPLAVTSTGTNGATGAATTANVLTIYYVLRGHVAFQLINQRVVAIVVAAVG